MSWRDRYSQGSFRGVAFLTEEHTHEGGRRGELHEFPERDTPWFEDLGRAARIYSIEALVLGVDYMDGRDALLDALEKKGAGELVHPYFGTLTVAVQAPFSLTESTAEGGMARFSITFVEAGEIVPAEARADTSALALQAADVAIETSLLDFEDGFTVDGFASFVEDAAADVSRGVAAATEALAVITQPVEAALAVFQDAVGTVNVLAIDLVRAPNRLANAIVGTVRAFSNLHLFPGLRFTALRALLSDVSKRPAVIGATPARARQRANQTALIDLATVAIAAELVRTGAAADFASYDDAIGARDGAAEQLDALAFAAADAGRDGQADALDLLRRALVRDITARGGSLARLYRYAPEMTEPALVIAQRLHGAPDILLDRAAELVTRNRIAHPGFVAGGRPIEVRTDG